MLYIMGQGSFRRAMDLQLMGMFKPFKACALEKTNKAKVCKMAVPCSMIKGDMLFIDISLLSTASKDG